MPDTVSDDAAALCEPLSVGIAALRKAGVKEDQIDQMLVKNPRAIFEARNA